ncbi:6341_t:CDS:2 [Scutellospora calospora]|uniref:6341_t:CDS:1 n=1 Tax=Scutellospora calospora TaxID=85575 RepID=A0ACA9N8R0_9GLOM|nr:6341_t:CDS:2 [Scutellospora calospora]
MSDDKKILDQETARIKQLLKDQEDEINIEKEKYEQLLEMFSNVKKNVADVMKESLPEILKEALKGTDISDDMKKLVTEKSGEVIEKLSEKIKGVGIKEETNTYQSIGRPKKIEKPIVEERTEKEDLLNDGSFHAGSWNQKNFDKYFKDLDVIITRDAWKS